MPTQQEHEQEWRRYFEYYKKIREETGTASPFEVFWMGHIAGLRKLNGHDIEAELTEWVNDPLMARHYSPELQDRKIIEEIEVCKSCDLHGTRKNTVPGSGPIRANLMCVGEAPGKDEDEQGNPFVGVTGQAYFEGVLEKYKGWLRSRIRIVNILKCRPPGNRNPKPEEMHACTPFLRRQIALTKPKCIIALGKFPGRFLTGYEPDNLYGMLGKIHWFEGIPVVVSPHPSAYCRQIDTPREERKPRDYGADLWNALNMAEWVLMQDSRSDFWSNK